MTGPTRSVRAAAGSVRPQRSGPGAEPAVAAGSTTNRCPKQRFACTDGLNPVVFFIERIEETSLDAIERIEETSLDAIERIEPGTPEGIEEAE